MGETYNKGFLVQAHRKKMKDKVIRCILCPNNCVLLEGKQGLCCARMNIEGELYSIVYGYPYGLHIDPIEKKPLYHYFPGENILSFGTFGCNFYCRGCQNFDMTRADASASIKGMRYYHPKEIVDMAIKNNIKMIAYTYNEPTIFFEYMLDVAKIAKSKGIKNVIVSNGYINPGPLKELCRYIDAANIDIKGISEKFYSGYARAKLGPVLKTIKTIHRSGVWLELTNLIIPGLNDDTKDIKKLCTWVRKNVGKDTPLHFSRFYPYYHASNIPPTPPITIIRAEEIAKSEGIKYVYLGNIGRLDNTYCPRCGTLLIERETFNPVIRSLKLRKNSTCTQCGTYVPGVFV
ncbi:MAG: AmmeMemoRadiSam system radical SAM enzyme [Candidatus Woesearchaeota archaeon]